MTKQTSTYTFGYNFAKLANLSKPKETQSKVKTDLTAPKLDSDNMKNTSSKPKNIKYTDLEKILDPTHTKYKNNITQVAPNITSSKTEFKDFQEKSNAELKSTEIFNSENSGYLEDTATLQKYNSENLLDNIILNPKESVSGSLVALDNFKVNNQPILSDFSTHNYLINFIANNDEISNNKTVNTELKQSLNIDINLNNTQLDRAATNLNNQNNFILKNIENKSYSIINSTDTSVSQSINLANSFNSAIKATSNIFGKNIENLFDTNQLVNSQYISFDNPLENLNAKVDPTNNNESWQTFFKKIFSKDTVKEIGNTLLNDAESLGKDLLKSLIPTFSFNSKKYFSEKTLNEFYDKVNKYITKNKSFNTSFSTTNSAINSILGKIEYVDVQLYAANIRGEKTLVSSTIRPYIIGDIGGLADQLELALIKKLNINTDHNLPEVGIAVGGGPRKLGVSEKKRHDQSELFRNFVSKNPLLGQHQFELIINYLGNEKVTNVLDTKDIEENLYTFRIQNIKIPDLERSIVNEKYGNSLFSSVANLQANVENKAELEIICDRNLNTLEYLTRLTGLGVCESPEKSFERIYNLSNVSDSNFNEDGTDALLSVINGRSLNKSLNFENPEWEFNKSGPDALKLNVNYKLDYTPKNTSNTPSVITKDKIIYAMLPEFYFENFKIINLDYNFKLENSNSVKVLKLKATCTWSNIYLRYNDPNTVDYYDTTVAI